MLPCSQMLAAQPRKKPVEPKSAPRVSFVVIIPQVVCRRRLPTFKNNTDVDQVAIQFLCSRKERKKKERGEGGDEGKK